MQVGSICNADAAPDPPRTPPSEDAGANENPSEINDIAEENEATEDEDEEESASVGSGKRRRARQQWSVLGEWDADQFLTSELEANILRVGCGWKNPALSNGRAQGQNRPSPSVYGFCVSRMSRIWDKLQSRHITAHSAIAPNVLCRSASLGP